MRQSDDYVFHRDLTKEYPLITHGEGVYLYSETGKKYLDACSGAIAVTLGHGEKRIAEAIYRQASDVAFAHTMRFETSALHELCKRIGEKSPEHLNRVYLTSGGSEAVESALKLARQYQIDRGKPEKVEMIGRFQSYHGNTWAALSVGGDIRRREVFKSRLVPEHHIHPPFCNHCPFQQEYNSCENMEALPCASALEAKILEIGAERIAAFIAEPIGGSATGALVPPDGYYQQIRGICDKYDVLFIADEVMTGFGRTGSFFAIEHWNVEPDIITFGKGVSSGYLPLGGMVVHDKVIDSLYEHSKGKFVHGFTYVGHPVTAAAGLATVKILEEDQIIEKVQEKGTWVMDGLHSLAKRHPMIGEIRGKGLLIAFELVQDQETQEPFPPEWGVAEKLNQLSMERGAVFYPGSAAIAGIKGDHLLIGPPLTITQSEVVEMLSILEQALVELTCWIADQIKKS